MDFYSLRNELEKSSKIYNEMNRQKEDIIEEELVTFNSFIDYISPILPYKEISNLKCILIYQFDSSKKSSISPEVYYCEDGKIRYQVFKANDYVGYRPNAVIVDGYAIVEPNEMFKYINLSDVYDFFVERIDTLKVQAENTEEEVESRKSFLNMFNKMMKSAK